MHTDYLKHNSENSIIFSCGTALASLIRMGIRPDFHIEMERPSFVVDVLNVGTSQEQRKGITLLCLHTVSPLALACFEEACFAVKPNDAGSLLVHEYFSNEKLPELAFGNPTVANCALAFGVAMGFKEVHLVGVDLGMKDEDKHHSEKSIYYDLSKQLKKKNVGVNYADNDRYRDGNFGGKVRTPLILDMSRSAMERLLSFVTQRVPEFQCFNTNDGVKIEHTLSMRIADMPAAKCEDKDKIVRKIKAEHFFTTQNTEFKGPEHFLAPFFKLKNALKLDEGIANEQELFVNASNIFKTLKRNNDTIARHLLRGTINCYLGAIFENTLYCGSKDDFNKNVHAGIHAYNEIIDKIFQSMQNKPLEVDDTVEHNLRSILVQRKQQGSEK